MRVPERVEPSGDRELFFVFGLVWLAAAARVVFVIASGDAMGPEPTLAALIVVGLPLLLAVSATKGDSGAIKES